MSNFEKQLERMAQKRKAQEEDGEAKFQKQLEEQRLLEKQKLEQIRLELERRKSLWNSGKSERQPYLERYKQIFDSLLGQVNTLWLEGKATLDSRISHSKPFEVSGVIRPGYSAVDTILEWGKYSKDLEDYSFHRKKEGGDKIALGIRLSEEHPKQNDISLQLGKAKVERFNPNKLSIVESVIITSLQEQTHHWTEIIKTPIGHPEMPEYDGGA